MESKLEEWRFKKIPKIVHFYWDGNRMSYLQYMCVVSFHKLNPDWEIKVYGPQNKFDGQLTWTTPEQKKTYTGKDYNEEFKNLPYVQFINLDFKNWGIPDNIPEVFKSDIFRWYLLAEEGGVWSDIDILYTKPLSHLATQVDNPEEEDMCIVFDGHHHIIGFYASAPKNPFFGACFNSVKNHFHPSRYQSVGSTMLNSMFPNLDRIKTIWPDLNFTNLSMKTLYAYTPEKLPVLYNELDESLMDNTTLGIHWYNGDDMTKDFLNNFEENYTKDTTLINLLKKIENE